MEEKAVYLLDWGKKEIEKMNDRYLFRGKRVDNGEWVEGYYYKSKYYRSDKELCDYITIPHPDVENASSDHFMVIPETVGQCTGLKDKNGKLIFEGDICKHRSNCSDKLVISAVAYTNGHFLALVNEHSGFELSEKLEIIGNIHDPNYPEVNE